MKLTADLTFRETAHLSGVNPSAVEKAVELKVMTPISARARVKGGATRRLPLKAVVYFSALREAGCADLPVRHKKAIWTMVKKSKLDALEPVEFAPGMRIDLPRLSAEPLRNATAYRDARDRHIVSDPEILGGTPVIRGTRISVYSVLGRLQNGDDLEDLVADYPDIPKNAFGAASLYATAHPMRGRPSGRPWRNAA